MSEPLSLGEILAEALRASKAYQPEPPPLVAWTDDQIAFHYNWLSARQLAEIMTDHYGLAFDDAWHGLCHVPDEMLPLLETPCGWSVLAAYAAADLGVANCHPFLPAVH